MSVYFKRKKDPHEKVVLGFDFANELTGGETLSGTPAGSISLVEGTDASPASVLNGAASISGTQVLQPVQAGVDGCVYAVEVVVSTSNANKVLALTGLLRVEEGA